MRKKRIVGKLILSFCVVALLAAAVGAAGIYAISNLRASDELMYSHNVIALSLIGEIIENCQEQSVMIRDASVLVDNPSRISSLKAEISRLNREMTKLLEKYEATIVNPEDESDYYNATELYKTRFRDIAAQVFERCEKGDAKGAQEIIIKNAGLMDPILKGYSYSKDVNLSLATKRVQSNIKLAKTYTIIMIAVMVSVMIAAILMGMLTARMISKPLMRMVSAANSISKGDLNVDVTYKSNDEVGELAHSFMEMIEELKMQTAIVEKLAEGDLTASPVIRSEIDSLNIALGKMLDNLNGMFKDINFATAQVFSASRQIAEGAQGLAQGSSEQAATIQELLAAVSDVSQKTKQNAIMAGQAADLDNEIKTKAEKGAQQMANMMSSVNDIADSSNAISKVIRVIDDIAFQTNILALNAAVEAARAGQHGKGFAVVAEEVRSLAAKSAEAAKDTGGLIADSIEKAELGLRIAKETSESFKEILSEIKKSSTIMSDISSASGEQSDAIASINAGIEQVAVVVTNNSSMAQESAAASEELSSQSSMLQEMVAQFKTKDRRLGAAPEQARIGEASANPASSSGFEPMDDFGKY